MHSFNWHRTMLREDLTVGQYARRAEVDALTLAYCAAQRGDDQAALVAAISDVLADLNATEEQAVRRAVFHGFVRGRKALGKVAASAGRQAYVSLMNQPIAARTRVGLAHRPWAANIAIHRAIAAVDDAEPLTLLDTDINHLAVIEPVYFSERSAARSTLHRQKAVAMGIEADD